MGADGTASHPATHRLGRRCADDLFESGLNTRCHGSLGEVFLHPPPTLSTHAPGPLTVLERLY